MKYSRYDRVVFKQLRSKLKTMMNNAYVKYINIEQNLKSNVRSFWNLVQSRRGNITLGMYGN